jgi:hypothetical protein
MARLLLPLVCALLALSCSSKEKTIPVTGTVTWNGEPIPEGDILLYPENNPTVPDPGKITNGKYKVDVKAPGKKIVHVFYSREKPMPAGVMGQKEREQMIPKEYNHASRLRIDVAAGGNNQFDFHLPEKK